MKIVVDENIPLRSVESLRAAGHAVIDIRGTVHQGQADGWLWTLSQQEDAVLVTTDKGFSRTVYEPHKDILIVRLRQPNRQKIHERVMLAFAEIPAHEWAGLTVVMRDETRSLRRWRLDEPSREQ